MIAFLYSVVLTPVVLHFIGADVLLGIGRPRILAAFNRRAADSSAK